MTTVVATHAVGNMDTWLEGGDERNALFESFCWQCQTKLA